MQIGEELQYRKIINPLDFFEHLPLQALFHDDEARTKGIFGGNRSSKTYEGSHYVVTKCLAKPKQRWWACAESFPDSVNIQQRKVWEIVPKNRIKYGRYDEINGFTNRKLLFDNGSIIIFKSYDQKREAFESDDIDGIWNDEEPPYDIYREQRMRLIDRNGEMLITMTSIKGITDLIQDVFEDHDVVKSAYAPVVKRELPRIVEKNDMRFYLFWTTENPYIDQQRVQHEIRLMTQQEILSRIYGLPINLSGKIYMKFNRDIHVVPLERVPKDATIYHILDPHDRKPWAMIWVAIDKTHTSYVVDEYPNRNFNEIAFGDKSYTEYCKIIRLKEEFIQDYFGKEVERRIIDPNFGNKTVQLAERQGGQATTTPKLELLERGFMFMDGIDTIEAGHLKVRESFHYETKGKEIIVQPKIFFVDYCENTIRHHSRYSRKDIITADDDVKDSVKPRDKYKDYCDLVRYYSMSNPQYFGKPEKDYSYRHYRPQAVRKVRR